MNIKLILIIVYSILYGLFEIFMSQGQQDNRRISESGDKGSIWILIISISMGYWLSFIIGATTFLCQMKKKWAFSHLSKCLRNMLRMGLNGILSIKKMKHITH